MIIYSNYYYISSIHYVTSVLSGACRRPLPEDDDGLSYAAFSLAMFYTGSPHQYGEIVAITVATISFTKIGMAIRGMVVAHKTITPSIRR